MTTASRRVSPPACCGCTGELAGWAILRRNLRVLGTSRASLPGALWPAVVLTASAVYYAVGVLWLRARRGAGIPSFDLYTSFYPNIHYALRSLREGGGLLWNPFQDCGQPFYGESLTGLLYPVNLVFALLDREPALVASVVVNLFIGGIGAFLLCRELRLAVVAALCGALAFQLGGTAAMLAAWTPTNIAVYVWIPVAMWRAERVLRQPSVANGVWLGVALTLQLLPGYPQPWLFTYQLIGLRIAWAVIGRQAQRPFAVVAVIALGCVLPLFLGAVQLLPWIEVARDSVRPSRLSAAEIGNSYTWAAIRTALTNYRGHAYPSNAVTLAGAMLCTAAICRRRRGGLALFYFGLVVLYACLSLGPDGPLFEWYAKLPMGSTFRMPIRFLWVSGYALAVLTAFGVDALLRQANGRSVPARARGVALTAVGGALFYAFVPRLPTAAEWLVIIALTIAGVLLAWGGRAGLPAFIVVLALFLNLASMSKWVINGLRAGDLYDANAEAFALLRERMTPQDRVALVGAHVDLALMPKSASLFRVASIYDYTPQASRAYADFYTWMRIGRATRIINDWYYPMDGPLPPGFNERLFNLTAARYLLVGHKAEPRMGHSPTWRVLAQNARWTIYENPRALARARFVARIEVVPEERVLPMLAGGAVQPAEVALVVEAPASAFHGQDADASGAVRVVVDEPERLVVRVEATAAGFLFLADQYAPGWEARVNGAPAELLRANHAFRLVEVPAGGSDVVFRYRPRSLYLGALLSSLTVLALAVAAGQGAVRRARAGAG